MNGLLSLLLVRLPFLRNTGFSPLILLLISITGIVIVYWVQYLRRKIRRKP
jgi:hypothetical protein